MADIVRTPEYKGGIHWADENLNLLRERYSSAALDTSELRTFLFTEAERLYPHKRGNMDNDLRQTLWVAGVIRRLVDTMPFTPQALAAVFDISSDLGSILGAEQGKKESFDILKKKPEKWWTTPVGDASPDDVVAVLARRWQREVGRPQRFASTDRWEVLLDMLGTREIRALETLKRITIEKSARYSLFDVDGRDISFQVMAADMWQGDILAQGAGEIVG
jgi:hypothetical protein